MERGLKRTFGFAGWSGSGKTTLIERLIPALVGRGLVVSLVKHAHHDFDTDVPGKDSYRHRQAGCTEVLVSSANRWAIVHELRGAEEMSLGQALALLSPCDLVLVEGYKRSAIPKLEVYRAALDKPLMFRGDPHIVAAATDATEAFRDSGLPVFPLDAYDALATLVVERAAPADASH
ncbi:MAG TPA: molybdopterin-guanine dinucleotide biosynthesis protein B [Casimicrobiaceae bacterium]|nr:molybdopterin-guanine dinucleotide biosynthesis protein B [Casimicrobiaceae bacterium]